MATIEQVLARFIFLFLKHLTIEINNLMVNKTNDHLPKKSILRKSYDKNNPINQNNSIRLTNRTKMSSRRKVFFTHVDSFEFDPRMPCKFINLSRHKKFYLSPDD